MKTWALDLWDKDFKEVTGLIESLPNDLQEPIRKQLIRASIRTIGSSNITTELQSLAFLKCWLRTLPKDT